MGSNSIAAHIRRVIGKGSCNRMYNWVSLNVGYGPISKAEREATLTKIINKFETWKKVTVASDGSEKVSYHFVVPVTDFEGSGMLVWNDVDEPDRMVISYQRQPRTQFLLENIRVVPPATRVTFTNIC